MTYKVEVSSRRILLVRGLAGGLRGLAGGFHFSNGSRSTGRGSLRSEGRGHGSPGAGLQAAPAFPPPPSPAGPLWPHQCMATETRVSGSQTKANSPLLLGPR